MAADVVDRDDAGMIQRRREARLSIESSLGIRLAEVLRRDELDRHLASESKVAGAIDVAHPTAPERSNELVHADCDTWLESHALAPRSIYQLNCVSA